MTPTANRLTKSQTAHSGCRQHFDMLQSVQCAARPTAAVWCAEPIEGSSLENHGGGGRRGVSLPLRQRGLYAHVFRMGLKRMCPAQGSLHLRTVCKALARIANTMTHSRVAMLSRSGAPLRPALACHGSTGGHDADTICRMVLCHIRDLRVHDRPGSCGAELIARTRRRCWRHVLAVSSRSAAAAGLNGLFWSRS